MRGHFNNDLVGRTFAQRKDNQNLPHGRDIHIGGVGPCGSFVCASRITALVLLYVDMQGPISSLTYPRLRRICGEGFGAHHSLVVSLAGLVPSSSILSSWLSQGFPSGQVVRVFCSAGCLAHRSRSAFRSAFVPAGTSRRATNRWSWGAISRRGFDFFFSFVCVLRLLACESRKQCFVD